MKMDIQDYVTNRERSTPSELPTEVYVVYYQSETGEWIWSLPCFHMVNARMYANALSRPTKILTYTLTDSVDVERKQFSKRTRMVK